MEMGSKIKTRTTMFVLFLLLGAFFAVMATNTVAAAQDGDYTYTTSGSPAVATITGYTGTGGAITIPATLGGFATRHIGANAFDSQSTITSVIIPNSVTSIGEYAFYYCDGMTAVTIPTSVTSIGISAFDSCAALTTVTIPSSVTTIADYTFYYCESLRSVTIPSSVTSIGANAFAYCGALTSVTIPNSVTSIGEYAFDSCAALTSVTIPNSVTGIGVGAFFSCTSLTSATLGSGVTSIDDFAFGSCAALTSISFLGMVAPTVGDGWIEDTPAAIRGHAMPGSNFPAPGTAFNGLMMGTPLASTPGAPTGLTAIAGNAQIALNWTAPASDGGSAVISYKVYRNITGSSTVFTLVASPTVLNYLDAGRINGVAYYYKVSAVNAAGEGANSTIVSSTPFTVPNAPTGLTAVPSNAQVTLSWVAPAFNGGSVIDYYVVYQNGVALAAHPTGLSTVISGLTNGQAYTFTVAAHNVAGNGAQSASASATPAATVPDAPTGLTAVPGNTQVALSWTAPAFNGGSVITGYRVYRSTTEGGAYALINSPSGTTYVDSGRTNGQAYWYKVSAVNIAGEGANSTLVSSTPFTLPNAPSGLAAIAGNAQVRLNWTAPAFNGGNAIDYYVVYQDGVALGTHATGLSTVVSGLINGQTYSFNVRAHNAAGNGAPSEAVTVTPIAVVPGPPTGLAAVAGNMQVTLNWTAPVFNGGSVIDYYVVYQNGVALAVHPTGLSTLITGLTNGQLYSFTVAAHNVAGIGAPSEAVTVTPIAVVPGPPTGLAAVPGNMQVALNWIAPTFTGGSAIDYYVVYQDGVALGTHVTGLSTSITGLTNGRSYTFAVAAHNVIGNGAQSASVTATPAAAVPNAPTGLTAVAGNAQIALNWTAPAYNGGVVIDYYVVYQDGVALAVHPTGLSTIIYGLTNGRTYQYEVSAVNSVGEGAKSDIVPSTPYTAPNAPTGLTAVAGNAQVGLSWTAPVFNGGSVITGYKVYRNITGSSTVFTMIASPTVTNYVDTGRINGAVYYYKVSAVNAAGEGAQSTVASATPRTVPDAPTGLAGTSGENAQVTLTWTAPVFNGGSVITGYKVYRNITGSSTVFTMIASPTATNYVDTGRINGAVYYYKVSAVNAAGEGAQSTAASAIPYTTPGAPTGLAAVAGNAQAALSWTAPANGGSVIDYYVVYKNGVALVAHYTGLSAVISGLVNGQSYSFTVAAHNAAGLGAQSASASATPFTAPDAPTGLTAVPGNAQVTLNWTAPANGGSVIDHYVVYQNGVALIVHPTALSAVISGLVNGQSYSFTVAAHNIAGNGTQSTSVSATPVTIPGAPQNLTATSAVGKVTLTWLAPTSTGGSAITGYKVYSVLIGGSILLANVSASTLSYVDSAGTAGTTYTYYVVATNAVGAGASSAQVSGSPQSTAADNTMLYVGIIIAIIVVIVIAVMLMRRKK